MKIIGLTGQSGAGKGEACRILERQDIPTIDTDAVYHTLLLTDDKLTAELCAAFGSDLLTNGRIDRKKLAACVFGKPDSDKRLHTLNAITHKYIMAKAWAMAEAHRRNGARAVVIDAPLLFEAHLEKDCDLLLAILSKKELRLSRIMARDGISSAEAERRIAAQKSDEFYRAHCHYILENNEDTASLECQIHRFLKESGLGLS